MTSLQRNPLPHVQVLLATYNGEAYLSQQIESILAQTGTKVHLLVSDDGSTDGTLAILQHYAVSDPDRVSLLPAQAGSGHPKWNFLSLLASSNADYVAFADQDDVWLPQKLQRSMAAMHALVREHGYAVPLLVFTDMKVVDRNLQPLADSFWANQQIDPQRIHSLRNLLVQNVVTGCTSVLNRALVTQCLSMPAGAAMHDWWAALVVCALGQAAVLHEPTVLYRQHGGNAVGAVLNHTRRLLPRPRFHTLRRAQWELAARQGEALLTVLQPLLSPPQRHLLSRFVLCETSPSRWVRVATWLRYRFFQKGLRPNLAILWYLWDMNAAKRQGAKQTREEF